MPNPQVISTASKTELARTSAIDLVQEINDAIATRGIAHISLTGGSMGGAILEQAPQSSGFAAVDWTKVHFWWSDERFVGKTHEDRNAVQAREALLDSLKIPAENIHEMGDSDHFSTPEEAALAYQQDLKEFATAGERTPVFDLMLLGMGSDGHIASLFPSREEIMDRTHIALAVHDSPKPPPQRVTLTLPVINHSRKTWFLVAGADKSEAVERLVAASKLSSESLTDETLRATPAAGARAQQETLIRVTQDALESH